ncbi:glycoside hydrolase family 5 protein [Sphaerobolus stellatus SS14]|uniref:Glycoside hydrolase family 5 protein n=1 Tax=Sphaerobolus stellatus (strain SS14) TaxID=990650 RepID=A0A0C9W1S5_SPHS4|nr:glycoside hydrolase family 5 protein [Sphaerobolus stellatus SS14]
MSTSFLRVEGTKLVDGDGKETILRGAGLGGWMNMENFISGYPGREFHIREALARVVGQEKSELFFDKFLEYFFQAEDAKFFKSLGLNCIRLAFNYRHFEDDMDPRVLKESGFKHLDRAIELCAQQGIYTVLDLHTAPGGQNQDWHSDNPGHYAFLWDHKDFQDRLVWLWEKLAEHYKENPWVAGFNVLNEPCDPQHVRLVALYNRLHDSIRKIDTRHVIFLDGNTFASDFTHFGDAYKNWTNTAYSIHDYSTYGFPQAPERYVGNEEQKGRLKRSFERKQEWMVERGLCVWNGEWGPVYARRQYDGEATDSINESRYRVLKDQLEIYDQAKLSWSIWLYKDIGFQGMTFVSPDTPYMKLFEKFLAKKQRMAVDAWGTDDSHVKHIFDPLTDWIAENIEEKYRRIYPWPVWSFKGRVAQLSRFILVAEYLVEEWAEHFRDKTEKEIVEIAKSFSFENCVKREGLNKVLTDHAASRQ